MFVIMFCRKKGEGMKNNQLLICPNCSSSLHYETSGYKCENGHCFDLSASGYLNLVIANKKRSNNSGDNKVMVNARKLFLQKDYYSILINSTLEEFTNNPELNYLDIGCGEGYFTNSFKRLNKDLNVYAIDISKQAIAKASKLNKKINWIVSGVNSLPIKNHSIDVITKIFAPHDITEFVRVLKPNGKIITVTPAKKHLFQLKELLYENAYLNDEKIIEDDRIELIKEKDVFETITILSGEDIANLLKMTPYYYKTSEDSIKKILDLEKLTVDIAFKVRVYKTKPKA